MLLAYIGCTHFLTFLESVVVNRNASFTASWKTDYCSLWCGNLLLICAKAWIVSHSQATYSSVLHPSAVGKVFKTKCLHQGIRSSPGLCLWYFRSNNSKKSQLSVALSVSREVEAPRLNSLKSKPYQREVEYKVKLTDVIYLTGARYLSAFWSSLLPYLAKCLHDCAGGQI